MLEAGMTSAHIILVIFAELFLEMISLALVATAMFFVFRSSGPMILGMAGLVALYAGFVLGIGALGFSLSRQHANGPPPKWAGWMRLHAGRWRTVQRSLRQLRDGINGLRDVRYGVAGAALLASLAHIALRLAVLPVIVYSFHEPAPLAPLILWPVALTYGGVVAPMPGGGGAIEVGFKAALGHAIPANIFGASLIWWRFYNFYIFILIGALAAGGTVLRALREDDDKEVADSTTDAGPVATAAAAAPGASPATAVRSG
jgi:uncharacterized protein (TIRG00374 family)